MCAGDNYAHKKRDGRGLQHVERVCGKRVHGDEVGIVSCSPVPEMVSVHEVKPFGVAGSK